MLRFESIGRAPVPQELPRGEEECEFTRALRGLMERGPAPVDCALQGSVAMPAARELQPADTLIADADEAQLSADLLASALPHGYAQVRDRVASPYDADVLDFFRQLLHLEEQYANGLHALAERFQQPAEERGLCDVAQLHDIGACRCELEQVFVSLGARSALFKISNGST